jgi:hypothetical protein
MAMATFDTVSAYLHQAYPDTLKPLYLKLPKQLAEACGLNPAQLYRVKKYLYGLPDAGRAYYLAYSTALEKHGYTKSFSDPCLFMRIDPSQNIRTYVWIHVDDTFVSSTCPEELQRFQTVMSSEFPMTANYDVNSHLGISIEHEPDGAILLRQPKLLHQILDEYTDPPSKSKYPAMTPSKLIDDDEVSSQDEDGIRHKYMRLLGQLMYLSNSRPDILTALSYASTKSINPSESDFQRLLQVVSYLRQTPDYGLRLFPKKDDDPGTLHLTAYVDAGYMSHEDASSHTGYTVALGSVCPQSYFLSKSSKQKSIATSSTHAEIRALFDLSINLIYLINLFKEIQRPIELPVVVYEDNQATIDLVNSSSTKITKSKHYLMLIHYIRQQVEQGLLKVNKVDTTANISNILTKIIQDPEFFNSIIKIMGLKPDDQAS